MESLLEAKKRIVGYGLAAIKKSQDLFVELDSVYKRENGGVSCGCAGELDSVFDKWQHEINSEIILTQKKNNQMNKEFILSEGLHFDIENDIYYTNDNMTDEAAVEFIAKNKNRASLFTSKPADWEKKVDDAASGKSSKKNNSIADAKIAEAEKPTIKNK